MIHRHDCTLLGYKGDMNPFGSLTVVCAAPKLRQGEEWLDTAKAIAVAMNGAKKQETDRILAEFCDSCGIGPPYGDNDKPIVNVRATVTWKCEQCDHINERPLNQHEYSIPDAAAIAVDAAIKNAGKPTPKMSRAVERLLIDAANIAVATERARKSQNS
jgi:hypothetical protein